MRQHLATALTIVGAVVGAGFASGREVYQFFSRFGVRAIIGVIIAIMMLTLLSIRVLVLAKRHRAKTLVELMQHHLGTNYAKVIKVVLLAALWLGLGVMLSGAGAAGESLGIGQLFTIVLTAAVTAACLNIGIAAVSQANTILIPVLMAVSVYIFCQGMKLGNTTFLIQDASQGSWPALVWSAVLYAGLNSLLVFVVIPPLLQVGKPLGVVLGCGVFGVLLLCTTLLLLQFPVVAATSPIPLLSITTDIAPQVPALYGVLLWTALTTTALANGVGLVEFLVRRYTWNRLLVSASVVISCLPLAFFPFARLVAVVYTALGYVALLVVAAIVFPGRYKRAL